MVSGELGASCIARQSMIVFSTGIKQRIKYAGGFTSYQNGLALAYSAANNYTE